MYVHIYIYEEVTSIKFSPSPLQFPNNDDSFIICLPKTANVTLQLVHRQHYAGATRKGVDDSKASSNKDHNCIFIVSLGKRVKEIRTVEWINRNATNE